MTRAKAAQVDMPSGHIVSWTIAQNHSACQLTWTKGSLGDQYWGAATNPLKEIGRGWGTGWEREEKTEVGRSDKERKTRGEVFEGREKNINEVKENEIETETVWLREREREGVWKKHSSVIDVFQKGGKVLFDAGS